VATDGTWSLGTLAVGESREITVTVQNGTPAGGVTANVVDVRDGAGNAASGTLNIPVSQTAPFTLTRGNLSYRYENRNILTVRGQFTPPGTFDPTTVPIYFIATTPGVVVYHVAIPPGTLVANKTFKRYRFRDRLGELLGGPATVSFSTRDGILWKLNFRVARLSLPSLSSLNLSYSLAVGSDSYSVTAAHRVSGVKVLFP
jgi:hypothetical protein